ncbi:L-rhamnose operon transcriptional activator rhaR [Chlamydia abortus]|nr:L-rhamnose operon transcriptional activator rhaR [Chlamydia abortus]
MNLNYVWANKKHDELSKQGVIFFHSKIEFLENHPCKLYKIDEKFGNIYDHTHDYFQIWYVLKGEFLHSVNRKKYKMVQGNLFVIPPFAVHRVEIVPGKQMQIIGCEFLPHFINDRFGQFPFSKDFFDFAYLEHFLVDENEIIPKVALTGSNDLEVKKLLEEMYEEYTTQKPYFELLLKGNLLKLLSLIIREYTKESMPGMDVKLHKYRHVIAKAVEYIHNHYQEEIRLEQICKLAMLSKTYFCYLFKYFTGKTFNEYLIDLRVRKSTELLLLSDLSITDVCFWVGFNDPTYFSRIFKKHTGVSPSYYKKNAMKE